jgi:hypothetical protein
MPYKKMSGNVQFSGQFPDILFIGLRVLIVAFINYKSEYVIDPNDRASKISFVNRA